jgi:ATP-dependent exoDNAse (exonuclease V) beta subunit
MNFSETKQKLWSYQKGVSFDEGSHTYYYKNRTLTSVTTLVGYNFPKFDAKNVISSRLAEERGISVKELKEEWRAKAELGTAVHNLMELLCFDNSPKIDTFNDWVDARFLTGSLFWAENLVIDKGNKILFPEFPVFDGEYSVAGTCDLLVWNEATASIDIYDWKTNDSIMHPEVGFGKFGFGRLSHIKDTNFWHYALQLSVYKYILEKHGFKVGSLNLVHLTDKEYKVINVPYLSDEVLAVLESNL